MTVGIGCIGVLGVGHLAVTLLDGWRRSGLSSGSILLSPRGYGKREAELHGHSLATDSADLVRRSDVVLLAVRPGDAVAAVTDLPWRPGQIILSACAGVPIAALEAAAPSARVCRIMPLTAAGIGASPTTCFPALTKLLPLLERLGPVIPLTDERDFETATVSAAVYGWVLSLIGTSTDWAVHNGLAADAARRLTAATFIAAGRIAGEPEADISSLLSELVTPGGITEHGLKVLEAADVTTAWEKASTAVLTKLTS